MAQEPWVNFDNLRQLVGYELEALEAEAGQNPAGAFVAALESAHGPETDQGGAQRTRKARTTPTSAIQVRKPARYDVRPSSMLPVIGPSANPPSITVLSTPMIKPRSLRR